MGLLPLIRFSIVYSTRDMWRNRGRTLFAFLCVTTGVAAIVALRSLAFMVGDELTTNLAQINRGDIRLYATRGVPELVTLTEQGLPVFTEQATALIVSWAQENGVDYSLARLSAFLPVRRFLADGTQTAQTAVLLFVEPDKYPFYDTLSLREPANKSLSDVWRDASTGQRTQERSRPVVVSTNLLRRGYAMGDRLQIGTADVTFEVRGIAAPSAETVLTHPSAAFWGDYVYLSLEDLPLVGEPPLADQVFLKVPLGDDVAAAEEDLLAFLQRETQAETDFQDALRRTTVPKLAAQNREVANLIDNLIVIIGIAALMIGGVGVANTMLVIVNWRVLEIATLKTLGLAAHTVSFLFLTEALLLGGIGSVVGAVAGVGLSYAVQGVGEQAFALTLTWRVYPAAMGSGLMLGILVSGLFGLLPTLMAGQVRPAVVLRPNEAALPAAGLRQVLIALVAMLLVFGAMVGSIIGDVLVAAPEWMMGGVGGLFGAFAGLMTMRSWRARGIRPIFRRVRAIVIALVGMTLGAVLVGASVTLVTILLRQGIEGTGIWYMAERLSIGVLRGGGVVLVLVVVYGGYWLLVWLLGRMSPAVFVIMGWAMLTAFTFVAITWLIDTWTAGVAALIAAGGLVSGGWLVRRQVYMADSRIVLRAISNRRGRVALTLLALSAGIAGLSLVSLMSTAASRTLEYQLGEAAEGNVLIVDPTSRHGDEVRQMLGEQAGVQSFSQVTTYRGVLMEHNGDPVFLRHGDDGLGGLETRAGGAGKQGWPLGLMQRESLADMPPYTMKAGRVLESGDEGRHRIMVRASFMTARLGIVPGDRLLVLFENGLGTDDDILMQFRVVGVISRQSQQSGLEDMGHLSILPPDVLPDSVKPEAIATIAQVDESDPHKMDEVMVAVSGIPGVFAFELGALTQLAENLLGQLQAIPALVAWLTLVAGAAIIANTVALATQERRREIGIMKAIGLKGWRALLMLLVENALIGLLSGLIGVAIGAGVTVLVVRSGPAPATLWHVIDVTAMGRLVVLAIVVALVAALATAWNAAREKPMNVLHYE